MNTLDVIFNIFLATAPCSFLCHMLFMDRLRVRKCVLFGGYALLYLLQAAIFLLLQSHLDIGFEGVQMYKILFGIVSFILPFCIIKIDFFINLFVYFLTACYSSVIQRLTNYMDLRMGGRAIHGLMFDNSNVVLFVILTLSLPAVVIFYRRVLKPAFEITDRHTWRILWIVPAMFYVFNITTSSLFGFENIKDQMFFPATLMTAGGVFLTCGVLIKTLHQTVRTTTLKENARQIEKQLALQGEQYKRMMENYENTRIMRHDLRQHLSVLKTLSDDRDTEGIQKYLSDYFSALPEADEEIYCKNRAVNAIVRHYVKKAAELSAKMTVKICIPAETGINDADLCVVFGNCLENAVEACERLPRGEGFITVRALLDGDTLSITIDNSTGGGVRKEGGLFLSSKRKGAGIGIVSVRAVAKKYNGDARFETKDGVFQVSVVMSSQQGRVQDV